MLAAKQEMKIKLLYSKMIKYRLQLQAAGIPTIAINKLKTSVKVGACQVVPDSQKSATEARKKKSAKKGTKSSDWDSLDLNGLGMHPQLTPLVLNR